ncbi:GNAT family N-acetyltransferase [Variovorax sp. Sphag1AA]|uniref:GNAT family N-acetyltransferase n=1 Tax=Variovorax sp. Sphag1AA TaxID=2587027 RepID=UPI00161863E0|nr:GNAT family N-acetyltransferase [Variovorax sp. Sphag1AA]MBB3178621.1 ribosomal protein S18 acetylase RimI-like enzyme [Variovorax sp. Sphag1AA]
MPTSIEPTPRFRAFEGPSDFEAMVACANASFATDHTGFFRTVEEVARDYASFTDCVPQRDVWIAEVEGEVAGYVRAWHWAQADGLHFYGQFGVVAPQWRRRGIGASLHSWLESRQREMALAHQGALGHAHHAFVTEGEIARAALLEKTGYRVERYFSTMVRPTLDDIADFALPPGFEVRPVQTADLRAIWEAHIRAFRTHWGFSPPNEADYQRWQASQVFQPHLWQVAWDLHTGQVAGQVRTYIDHVWNSANGRKRGWTEFISVGEPWRRRGLARALISLSLRAQKAAGMEESGLGVDSQNLDGANRVYEDCGFVVVKRNRIFRKSLVPGESQ